MNAVSPCPPVREIVYVDVALGIGAHDPVTTSCVAVFETTVCP